MVSKAARRLVDLGLTQDEIASRLSRPGHAVHRQNVQQWQTGTLPGRKMLMRIQDVLSIKVGDWYQEPASSSSTKG